MHDLQDPVQRREQETWQAYRTQLYHFVRSRMDDDAGAEDVVHDVLVKVYTQRDALKDQSKFVQWMYQITRHAVIDYYRARKPWVTLSDDLAHEPMAPETVEGDEVAWDEKRQGVSAEQALARCLTPLVEQLPTPYRRAVTMSELEGKTQRSVASTLGLSVSGAKSRVQRGRKMLEDMLVTCCRFEFDSRGRLMDYEPRRKKCPACGSASHAGACGTA
jgi:RNA polymerase sigma-70 factor (ECF subfamily)